MPSLPRVLGLDDLPLAERMAARLDGELFSLADVHCPVDEPETPALRLAAVLAGRSARYIAELGTAAWVWGAAPVPPQRLELCVDLRARARPAPARHASVREVVVDDGEVRVLEGRRVTSPLRTAVDLARAREPFTDADVAQVQSLARLGGFGLAQCLALMDARRNLPDKRRAAARLSSALCQPALTR
ncbi:MAG: hypothetical protein JWP32_26 [Schumannella sp.]|nr:hypothetical protein [Schumannella sp.]